jgi:gliding motility-associated-like protein
MSTPCILVFYVFGLFFEYTHLRKDASMKFILQLTFIVFCSIANSQQITTIAGMLDSTGMLDSSVLLSKFNNPHGIAINSYGEIFIADRFNHVIRKIDTNRSVTTLAGSGIIGSADGVGSQASFNEPWDIEIDNDGNIIVADTRNNLIRKITRQGTVTTLAGTGSFGYADNSNPLASSFGNPSGIAIDKQNNIYVADHLTHLIRKISSTGVVSTLAGNKVNYPNNFGNDDGNGSQAKFYRPYGISIGIDDNLYVADEWNHLIRKVSLAGSVTTVAGSNTIGSVNGTRYQASFNYPWDIIQDSSLNLYVIDGYNHVIRKIDTAGNVSDFMGISGISGATDGNSSIGTLNGATGLAFDNKNEVIYVADTYNELIRKITIKNIAPTLVVGKKIICQYDTVQFTVSPSIFNSYEYYINDSLFYTSMSPLEGMVIPFKGVVKAKVKGINDDYEAVSNIIYLNSFPNEKPFIYYDSSFLEDNDSILLTSTLNASYLWSTSDTLVSVYAKEAGHYNVSVVNAFGCENISNDIVILKENELDLTTLKVFGKTNLCPSDSCILLAKKNDPIWYKNDQPYASFDSIITVKDSGIYYYVYYDSTGNLNFSDTIIVNVKSINNSYLNYDDTAFFDIPLDFNLFLTDTLYSVLFWNDTLAQDSLNPTAFGSYYATYDFNGCIQTTDTIVITQLISLDIGLSITEDSLIYTTDYFFCKGDSITVRANYDSISWYINDSLISHKDSVIIIDSSCSIYATYLFHDRTISSDTIKLVMNTASELKLSLYNDTVLFKGENIVITGANIDNYIWSNGFTSDSIVVDSTTLINLRSIDSNGCISVSEDLIVSVIDVPLVLLSLSKDSSFCAYDSILINANKDSIDWFFNDTLFNNNIKSVIVKQSGEIFAKYDTLGRTFYSDTIMLTKHTVSDPFLSQLNDTLIFTDSGFTVNSKDALSYNWNNGDTLSYVFVDTTSSLSLNLTDTNGCIANSDTIKIEIITIPKLVLSINIDSSFCYGDSMVVGVNYSKVNWFVNDTSLNTGKGRLTVNETSRIYVSYDTLGSTFYSDTILLKRLPYIKPFISTVGSASFYMGDSIELFANNSSSYLWNNSIVNALTTIKNTDTLWFVGTDTNGCSVNSDTVITEAIVIPILQLSLIGDSIICQEDSTILFSNIPVVKWYNNGVPLSDSTNLLSVKDTGVYYFSYYFNNDTTLVSDSIYIGFHSVTTPSINITVDTSLYYGSLISFSSVIPFNRYLWSNGDTNITTVVDSSLVLYLTTTDDNGCKTVSDTINVGVIFLPELKLQANGDTAFCDGEATVLEANRTNNESLQWFKNNEALSVGVEQLNIRDSGYYYYTTFFMEDTLLISDSIWIEVFHLPQVDFSIENRLLNKIENTAYPAPIVTDEIIDFEWDFGDEYAGDLDNISTEKIPEHQYLYPGFYNISLLVTDMNGCSNSVQKENHIKVENDLFIPSGFTPNGDGENDLFRPLGGGIFGGEIIIFNQWGELIFQTKDIERGWNGTRNSQLVESGNYTYVMKLVDITNTVINKKGVISLIR